MIDWAFTFELDVEEVVISFQSVAEFRVENHVFEGVNCRPDVFLVDGLAVPIQEEAVDGQTQDHEIQSGDQNQDKSQDLLYYR